MVRNRPLHGPRPMRILSGEVVVIREGRVVHWPAGAFYVIMDFEVLRPPLEDLQFHIIIMNRSCCIIIFMAMLVIFFKILNKSPPPRVFPQE